MAIHSILKHLHRRSYASSISASESSPRDIAQSDEWRVPVTIPYEHTIAAEAPTTIALPSSPHLRPRRIGSIRKRRLLHPRPATNTILLATLNDALCSKARGSSEETMAGLVEDISKAERDKEACVRLRPACEGGARRCRVPGSSASSVYGDEAAAAVAGDETLQACADSQVASFPSRCREERYAKPYLDLVEAVECMEGRSDERVPMQLSVGAARILLGEVRDEISIARGETTTTAISATPKPQRPSPETGLASSLHCSSTPSSSSSTASSASTNRSSPSPSTSITTTNTNSQLSSHSSSLTSLSTLASNIDLYSALESRLQRLRERDSKVFATQADAAERNLAERLKVLQEEGEELRRLRCRMKFGIE